MQHSTESTQVTEHSEMHEAKQDREIIKELRWAKRQDTRPGSLRERLKTCSSSGETQKDKPNLTAAFKGGLIFMLV